MFRPPRLLQHSPGFTQVADVVLVAAGVASLLVLLNVLYVYGFVAERHFTSTAGIVWYCALPSVVAFVCFGALRLTPTHKKWVSVVALAFAALVYGSEVTLEVTDRNEIGSLNPFARSTSDGNGTPRDADQMVAALQRSGVSAMRSIVTPVVRYDTSSAAVSSDGQARAPELIALSGIARRKTVICEDAGRWLIYDSDEHGFHNPPGLWKTGQVDIAVVGNSWTQGWCVPSDRNFVSLIRVRHPATVNLGMSGEGPLQILAIAKEYLSILQPKILIWFYFEGNSLREVQEEKRYELLLRYVHSDFRQGLVGRQDEIDQAVSASVEDRKGERERQDVDEVSNPVFPTLRTVIKLTSLRKAFGLVYGADAQDQSALEDLRGPTMELFREIVAAMKSHVSSWGGTLVFVYLPSSERYAAWTRPALSADSQQRTRVLQLVAEAAIPTIDIQPVFRVHGGTLLFREGRFNEEGNRVIAEHVLEGISSIVSNRNMTR